MMFKKTTCWIVLLYGVLLMGIGSYGYFEKQSLISLGMGGGFGLLVVISALLLFAKKRVGIYSATFITLIMAATFAVRYTMTQKTVPALLCVFSGGMLLFLLAQSVNWKGKDD